MSNLDFKIKDGETQNHFIWRVYKYGYKTGQITKEQAGDICSRELNSQFDESAYRKRYEAFDKMWIEVKDEYLIDTDDDLIERLSQIEEKEDELYKQQVKTWDQNRVKRAGLRHEARFDNLLDIGREYAHILSKEYPLTLSVDVKEVDSEKVGVLLLSDAHYGIVNDNFLNKYDTKIARKRFDKLTEETIKFCKLNNIEDLKIINLQDLINGLIHVSTRIENEEDVITQIIEVSEILANMMYKLAPYFNTIEYHDTLDNHSRVNANKKLSLEHENFARLMGWYLKPRLENVSNVKIMDRFDDTLTKIDILGETCFAVHGHNDNLNSVVQKLTLMTRTFPMSIFMGHIHHHYERDVMGVDVIVNGTLSGVDTYAKEKRLLSKPMQKILMYEKIDGKVNRTLTKHVCF